MFYILFAIAVLIAIAGNIYDVVLTERGIKAGLGVESWDEFVGEKPSTLALYIRDFAFDAPFIVLFFSFASSGFSLATRLKSAVAFMRSMWVARGIVHDASMFLAIAFLVCDIGIRSTGPPYCAPMALLELVRWSAAGLLESSSAAAVCPLP